MRCRFLDYYSFSSAKWTVARLRKFTGNALTAASRHAWPGIFVGLFFLLPATDNLCGLNELSVCWPRPWDIGVLRVKCMWDIVIKFATASFDVSECGRVSITEISACCRRGINMIYLSIQLVEFVSYWFFVKVQLIQVYIWAYWVYIFSPLVVV